MIGIDTNLLLRYVVADDEEQAQAAKKLLQSRCTEERPGFINLIVLCEFVWSLRSAYGFASEAVAEVLEYLLKSRQFVVEHADLCREALVDQRSGFDFSDSLIGRINQHRGCSVTYSFDKRATKMPQFRAV